MSGGLIAPPIQSRPSAPLVLSSLSFLCSALALVVAINGGTPRTAPPALWGEPEAQPSAAAAVDAIDGNHVTISGLTISRGQIAAGAVGATALADGVVTARHLAAGSVTPEQLSSDAVRTIARNVEKGLTIVGDVDEEGNVVRGGGFTVERTGTGEYVLTFAEPFLAPPVVLAVAQSYGTCYLPAASMGLTTVNVKCLSDLLGAAPMPANTRFSFYASPAL